MKPELDPILNPIPQPVDEAKSTRDFFGKVTEKIDQVYEKKERIPRSSEYVAAQQEARRDLKLMVAEIEYNAARTAIILGTRGEQAEFFERLEEILQNPGMYTTNALKESLHAVITEEFARGISRARSINMALGIDTFLSGDPRLSADVRFNKPLLEKNTTIVPIDLHLAFAPTDTVQGAIDRLRNQYKNRFNAVIILNPDKTPRGIVTLATLQLALRDSENNPQQPPILLQDIDDIIEGPFATVEIPRAEIEQRMLDLQINIYPVVETGTGTLNGILTRESVTFQESRYYVGQGTVNLKAQVEESELKKSLNP